MSDFVFFFISLDLSFHELSNAVFYCSTAKTREDIAKRNWKVKNHGSAVIHKWIRSNTFAISRTLGVLFLIFFISLDLSLHQLSNALFQTVLLQKLGSYSEYSAPLPSLFITFAPTVRRKNQFLSGAT